MIFFHRRFGVQALSHSAGVVTCHLGRRSFGEDIAKGPKHRCRTSLYRRKKLYTDVKMQCLSGRGDKDVEQISQLLPGKWEDILDWHVSASV